MITKENAPLQNLVGMEDVKNKLQELAKTVEVLALRAKSTGVKTRLGMDMVIAGNTGTGKTLLVDIIQKLLYSSDIIKNPTALIVDAVDYEEFSKSDAKDNKWDENIKKTKGGILVIENAHKLVPQGASNEVNKLDKLFKCMNDEWHNDPIVILSGLMPLKAFMNTNPNIANRFELHFDLKDFSPEELTQICAAKLEKEYRLHLNEDALVKLGNVFKYEFRNKKENFGNGHVATKKAEDIFFRVIRRNHAALEALPEDISGTEYKQKTYEEIMAELDKFVGIDEVKEAVQKIIRKLDFEMERKGSDAKRQITDHFLFLGNPGTGKTTIARIFAEILNALEVLPVGHLVEVTRKNLVSGYLGQTALAVEDAVNRAMGGVLFIDEAYSLTENDDSYGKEAITTLLELVENNRGKMVTIAAGYTKEMADFINANPGMNSRFNETIIFRDYTGEELAEIFRRFVKNDGLVLDSDAEANIENYFKKMYLSRNPKKFGNAREVRNVLNKAKGNQGIRLQKLRIANEYSFEMSKILTRADIEGEESLMEKDVDQILAELNEFIGMDSVKEEIRTLANKLILDKEMLEKGFNEAELTNVHLVITGNPGTGKTTVARKLGEIFKAIGLLPTSNVVSKERKDLLSSIMNKTAVEVDKACNEAMGGILFIDEAYMLTNSDSVGRQDETGLEAVAALMTRMSNDAGKFVVICAGYRKQMEDFISNSNPGFKRRFTNFLHIEDYSAPELLEIFLLNARKSGLTFTTEAKELLEKVVFQMVDSKDDNFGNAGEMVKLLEKVKIRKSNRLATLRKQGVELSKEMFKTVEASDIPYEKPAEINEEECFRELNGLIGLDNVKRAVKEIADYIKVERAKAEKLGKKFEGIGDHYLFVGNPGTGKTTVARIMGNIFYSLGVLPTNYLEEVTRKDLVAEYVGKTGPKTTKVVKSAVGGVLFIDEAYSLKSGGLHDFGQEATDALLPLMVDYKGKMVVIAAGYPREIKEWINTNSGLESRFNKTIYFEDYTGEELADIFFLKAEKDQLTLTPEAEKAMREYFCNLFMNRSRNFGNAREVNNFFSIVKRNQSRRLVSQMNNPDFDLDELKLLILEDVCSTGE